MREPQPVLFILQLDALTISPRHCWLTNPLSLYLIYFTQEETYIRRISSEEETKAELDPKPNSNVTFACLAQSWLSLTIWRQVSGELELERASRRSRANPSSPQTHHKTYLHTTSVFDNGVQCHSSLKKIPAQYPLRNLYAHLFISTWWQTP